MQTLKSTTVSHFWLSNGGLQLTSGDQRFAPESRSRPELSAQTRVTIGAVGAVQTLKSSTVSHLWLPNGGLQLTSGDQRFAPESRSRSELSAQTRVTIGAVGAAQTLKSSTVSHFWLPNGGLQFTSGDQRFAPESRSRLELSVQSQC